MEEGARDLYAQAILQYGSASQFRQLQEECAELIAKINQYDRERVNVHLLAEEIADVEIMIEQARMMIGDGLVDSHKEIKLNRLKDSLSMLNELKDFLGSKPQECAESMHKHDLGQEDLCDLLRESGVYNKSNGAINLHMTANILHKKLLSAGYVIKKVT